MKTEIIGKSEVLGAVDRNYEPLGSVILLAETEQRVLLVIDNLWADMQHRTPLTRTDKLTIVIGDGYIIRGYPVTSSHYDQHSLRIRGMSGPHYFVE